jgi:antitoxin (DNA-binding transcriptional repressor) of toxin-antitoxin stability system
MPTKAIDILEAQQQLADLITQAAAGTEIVLMDGQIPKARLVPIEPMPSQRVPGLHPGCITISEDFNAPLADDFWTETL